MTHINDYFEKLNPKFYKLWLSDKPKHVVKGGRSSTKSSVISQKLVEKKMKYPLSNMIAFRKQANTLRTSVYNQITWALYDAGVADQFTFRSNPMTILHKKWGTGFYFSGLDDPQKLKGFIIEKGFVSDLWFEECDALDGVEEIDTVEDTFIRSNLPYGLEVNTWLSYNPPRNPYSWINKQVNVWAKDDDWDITHATYLDDVRGYNSQQIIRKIERYKENDINYYKWMYLGEVVGMGDNVYNMDLIHEIEELPDNEYLIGLYFSTDTGHQVSATTSTCYGLSTSGNVFLLDTDYYSPVGKVKKRTPVEHCQAIREFEDRMIAKYQKPVMNKTIDSAEGAIRNQYYDMYGEHLHHVAKKKKVDMVDYVQDLLAQGRFFVLKTEGNKIFISEHQQYRWDSKSIETNPDNPSVVKVDDHTVDAFQYFVLDNLSHLGLAVGKGVR